MVYTLHRGDCLVEMNNIQDHSIDLILCDPPYGATPLYCDNTLNFEQLWNQYHIELQNLTQQ